MISMTLAAVCVFTLLVLCALLIWSCKHGSRLRTVIIALTLIHEAAVIIFPVFYSVFTDFYLETDLYMKPQELLTVMIGEAIFVTMFAIGISWNVKHNKKTKFTESSAQPKQQLIKHAEVFLLFKVLTMMALFIGVVQYISPDLHGADFKASHYSVAIPLIPQQIYDFMVYLFGFPSLVASAFIITQPGLQHNSRFFKFMAFSALLLLLIVSISIGLRGRIIWVASFIAICSYFNKRKMPIIIITLSLLILMPVVVLIGEARRPSSYFGTYHSISSRIELVTSLFQRIKESSDYIDESIILDQIARRCQAARNSIVLYNLYNKGRGAGFTHYLAALFPIPRIIWPSKPMFASIDGTVYGRAQFIVMREAYGKQFRMGPFLASAHAYWEGGWMWLLGVGLIIGLFWNYYIKWCHNIGGVLGNFIGILPTGALITDGFLTALLPLHYIIHFLLITVVPVYLIYKIIHLGN